MADETNLLEHIGIILDGNRRFAKRLGLKPWKGHELGAKKLEKLLDWCKEFNIKELTLYILSMENFNRSKEEVNHLMNLFRETFTKYSQDERLTQNDIKIRFMGNISLLPEDLQLSIKKLEEKTKNNSKHFVNFAIAYGGRDEIVNAAKNISQDVEDKKIKPSEVTKELFEDYLYIKGSPDFIIRTGGDRRSSNFLCYQSAYSEWFYLEKTWPEIEKEDFEKCIQEFKERNRNFGK